MFRVAAVSATLVCAAAGTARADDPAPTADEVKTAAEEFDLGKKAFKAKEFVEAAEHFEAADRNAPNATAIGNALRARLKADQLDRAATLAALALARYPKDAALKRDAKPVLDKAKVELHEVTVHCDTPCELLVSSKLVHGQAATERVVYVTPGEYTLSAGWSEGRTQQESVTATKGGKSELSFTEPPIPEKPTEEPAPAPAPAPVTSPGGDAGGDKGASTGGWSPLVFWVGAGLTGVLGGVTIWSGIDTQNNPGADAVRSACSKGRPECQALYDDGRSRQSRTNVLVGTTIGVAVITGLIGALATDWGGSPAPESALPARPKARVTPWVGWGDGAAVGALGRF